MSLTRDKKDPSLWHAVIYPLGRKKDPKTGKPSNERIRPDFIGDQTQAIEWYQQLKRSYSPHKTPVVAPTIDQALADFLCYYKNLTSERTYNDFIMTYERHLKPFFGQYRPNLLTSALFEAYKAKREQDTYLPGKRGQKVEDDTPEETKRRVKISKRTVQKEITYMQTYLRFMTDPDSNLAAPLSFRIKNYKASQTEALPKTIPSRREMILMIRSCRGKLDRKYRTMLAIAYYTGMRREELFELEGSNIDQQHGFIIIQGKGKKNRTIPIVTRLRPYIRSITGTGKIFINPRTGQTYDNADRLLARTCKRVGVPEFGMHTFRHAFAVHALMRGVSLRTLQLVMGHSTIKTTERYLQLVPTDLARDLDKVMCIAPRKKR